MLGYYINKLTPPPFFNKAILEINQEIENKKFKNFLASVDKFKKEFYNWLRRKFGDSGAKILLLKITNLLVAKYEYFHRHAYVLSYPAGLKIDPTYGCNLRCPGCRYSNPENKPWILENLSMQDYKKFIDEYGPYAIRADLFGGGEPLLNSLLPEFIKIATRYLIETHISTNFSFKNPNIEKLILSNLYFLTLSIDGASEEAYSIYRRGGNFNLVIENIKQMVNAKKRLSYNTPILEWQFLVFQHNKHEVKNAKKLARKLGVDQLYAKSASYWGWDDPSISIDPTFKDEEVFYRSWWKLEDKEHYLNKLLSDLNSKVIERHFSRSWTERYEQAKERFIDDYTSDKTNPTCEWLYRGILMEPGGNIKPCCERGNIFYSSLESISSNSVNAHELFNSNSYILSRIYFSNDEAYKKKYKKCVKDDAKSLCPACYPPGGDKFNKADISTIETINYLDQFAIFSKESKDFLACW